MYRQKWIIFLFITSFSPALGQIADDFSSQNDELGVSWEGDRDKFTISDDHQLRLNDSQSGVASLFQSTEWVRNNSWEIFFEMDFSPSENNRLEIYLWSNQPDLDSGNAILVSIGEDGNMDAITLIEQNQGVKSKLATGQLGLVADGPLNIRLKALMRGDTLSLSMDTLGGACFEQEVSAITTPIDIGKEFYFGINCIYSSTRGKRFYFDDIYVGIEKVDREAPRVTNINTSENEARINFSEVLNVDAATSIFELSPELDDQEFIYSKEGLVIRTKMGFDNMTEYLLDLSGIQDLSGNALDTTIIFKAAANPRESSVLVNEVLFNPTSLGSDYIELINVTSGPVSLNKVHLSNTQNGDELILSSYPILEGGEIIVLTEDVASVKASYKSHDPNRIFHAAIPRLNNDNGNVTISINELTIDAFDYNADLHHQLLDDVDGVSLERVSLESATDDASNWTSASSNVGFGTPGLPNSVLENSRSIESQIDLAGRIFSPNDDGIRDELIVNYDLKKGGYVVTVKVFSDSGNLIKNLRNNEIVSTRGSILWDGKDNNGHLAPIGIYVIHLSFFNLDGQRIEKKLTFGLGNFLN